MPRGTQESARMSARQAQVATFYLHGRRQPEIAQLLGVNQSTVSRDIAALQDMWVRSALIDFDRAKAEVLARIDLLEREYWEQYTRSKEPRRRRTVSGSGTAERPRSVRQVETIETLPGDPRYLAGVQWCIQERCRILGVYAAVKTQLMSDPNEPLRVIIEYADDKAQAPEAA